MIIEMMNDHQPKPRGGEMIIDLESTHQPKPRRGDMIINLMNDQKPKPRSGDMILSANHFFKTYVTPNGVLDTTGKSFYNPATLTGLIIEKMEPVSAVK